MTRKIYRKKLQTILRRHYNCGGFALETFTWYVPDIYDGWGYDLDYEEISYVTSDAVESMLNDFPDLRELDSMDDKLQPGEYMIAFRVSSDGDFHFLKRGDNGHWYHKAGSSYCIDDMRKADVMRPWNHRYDGPIVFFAKKR